MPDLLSHVLLGYTVASLISTRVPWKRGWTSAFLVGTILPDLSKVGLFFDDDWIEALVGGQVNFLGWHTLLGISLWVALMMIVVDQEHRKPVAVLVSAGALLHVVLDLQLRTASGLATYAIFWPFWNYRPPSTGLYLSGDPEVLVVSFTMAIGAKIVAQVSRR